MGGYSVYGWLLSIRVVTQYMGGYLVYGWLFSIRVVT